jgi:hypothetical protein
MKNNQHEQLFTELTPAEGAVVEGGGSFYSTVDFDYTQRTQSFFVKPGGTINLISNTFNSPKSNSQNPTFYAAIKNVNTGNKNEKVADVGLDTTTWTNVRGGNYVIEFRDLKDGNYVYGDVKVSYS